MVHALFFPLYLRCSVISYLYNDWQLRVPSCGCGFSMGEERAKLIDPYLIYLLMAISLGLWTAHTGYSTLPFTVLCPAIQDIDNIIKATEALCVKRCVEMLLFHFCNQYAMVHFLLHQWAALPTVRAHTGYSAAQPTHLQADKAGRKNMQEVLPTHQAASLPHTQLAVSWVDLLNPVFLNNE